MQKYLFVLVIFLSACVSDETFVEIQMNPPAGLQNIQVSRIEVTVLPLFPVGNQDVPPEDALGFFEINEDENNDGDSLSIPGNYAVQFPFELDDVNIEGQQFELIQVGFAANDASRPIIEAATVITVNGNNVEQAQFRFIPDQINCNVNFELFPCYTRFSFAPAALVNPIALALGESNDFSNSFFVADVITSEVSEFSFDLQDFRQIGGPFSTGASPVAIASGNFGGFNALDFATANFDDDSISISGSVTGGIDFLSADDGPGEILTGFLNDDPIQDLVVLNFFSNSISIFASFEGSPERFQSTSFPIPQEVRAIAVGDFVRQNGNEFEDIVVVSRDVNGGARIITLESQGQNAALANETLSDVAGFEPISVATIDLNFDGHDDLVLGTETELRLLLNKQDGSFRLHSIVPLFEPVIQLQVGDLDSDGLEDIIAVFFNSKTLSFVRFPGTDSVSFGSPREFILNSDLFIDDILIGDFDGFNGNDIAITTGISLELLIVSDILSQ